MIIHTTLKLSVVSLLALIVCLKLHQKLIPVLKGRSVQFFLLMRMHIREDLVYDKHSGELIGFTNLTNISDSLAQLEQSMSECNDYGPSLAKSMVVFMVRGLFSSLQFPYVHFACNDICGYQLHDPLWEAVWRIENCGLKVCCCELIRQAY